MGISRDTGTAVQTMNYACTKGIKKGFFFVPLNCPKCLLEVQQVDLNNNVHVPT